MKALGLAVRKSLWDGRAAGERRLIALTTLILLPLLAYFLLWQPAHNAVAKLRISVPSMRAQAALLRNQTAEVARLAHYPRPAVLDANALKSAAEAAAGQHHLRDAITAIDVQGGNSLRITLNSVSFNEWVRWLRALQQEQHMRAGSTAVVALAQPGMVKVTVTLTNGGVQ